MNPFHLPGDGLPDLTEQVVFQRKELILRVQDGILQLLQSGCRIPLRVGKRLLAHIVLRHQITVRIGHLKIVAENLIVLDAQIPDARALPVLLLKLRQPLFPVGLCFFQGIYRPVKALPDDTALPDGNGRLLHNRVVDQLMDILKRIHMFTDFL